MAFDLFHRFKKSSKPDSSLARKTNHQTRHEASIDAPKIRVVFMGTPEFAAAILAGLLAERYNIVGVVTRPDKPKGRKQTITESPVKTLAQERHLAVLQPETLDASVIETLKSWKPDIIIVAAYGKILPRTILDIPGFGCVNVHASLLPKWRGASPVHNALLTGESESGVTLMLMNEKMDAGDILAQRPLAIQPDEMRDPLLLRLTALGRDLLLETLPLWIERKIVPHPQDHTQATLCQLIEREDGHIFFTDDALAIYNKYRALSPWPGIFVFWKRENNHLRLKLHRIAWQDRPAPDGSAIGQVFQDNGCVGIGTNRGVVFLEEVQLEGSDRMPIDDFLRGNAGFIGSFLQ